MKQITSGSTRECLEDFFRRFGRTELIWKFTRVSKATEQRWRRRGGMPDGDSLLRLRHLLHLLGYKLNEFKRLSPEMFSLGQCVVLDVLTLESLAKTIGTETRRFYSYLDGGIRMSEERLAIANKILSGNLEQLKVAVERKVKELDQYVITPKWREVTPDSSRANQVGNIIDRFERACTLVRECGQELLDGPVEQRHAMRRKMCEGRDPALQATWVTLNNLLNERKQIR